MRTKNTKIIQTGLNTFSDAGFIQRDAGPALETERLWIIPLDFSQVEKYLVPGKLEADLGLTTGNRKVNKELEKAIIENLIPGMFKDPHNILFSTIWTMIEKKERKMAGDLCFKGAPNAEGEIEIGYGTYDEFSGKGLMTEAVGAIRKWALHQNQVKSIIAETRKNNLASQRILEKNKFRISGEDNQMILWKTKSSF